MPFRNIMDRAFAPETLATMYEAYDLAWAEVSGRFGDEPARVEFARNALAQAVLSAAETGAEDAATLKTAALEAFQARGALSD
jgi:hypothetical protein